jgi:hypothetical protein
MKRLLMVLALAAVVAGCRTNRGGTMDEYDMNYGATRGVHSETGSGPTYKPGQDLRDFDNIPRNTQGEVAP